MENKLLWLRLSLVSGIGPAKAAQLLSVFDNDIKQLFDADRATLGRAGLGAKGQDELLGSVHDAQIDAAVNWLQQGSDRHLISCDDENYPHLLKQTHRAPLVLFGAGNLELLHGPQLAIVGSRNASVHGIDTAYNFAKHLSAIGISITSGLALGIDSAGHRGALAGQSSTIAVMATGIDRIYPQRNQNLAAEIVAKNGLLLTEFALGKKPIAQHFPQRNRIIAGLALGVLVVESTLKSGSLITAKYAKDANRELFAIPGSIHNPMAKGCHSLIKQGAKLVETANDILEELAPSLRHSLNEQALNAQSINTQSINTQSINTQSINIGTIKKDAQGEKLSIEQPATSNNKKSTTAAPSCQQSQISDIDKDHQRLLDTMAYELYTIDDLVNLTGFSAAEVASMLLILELEGQVNSESGGRYQRCR